MRSPSLLLIAGVLAAHAAACKSVPTSVVLRIEAAATVPAFEELLLSVYADAGADVSDRRVPDCSGASCPAPHLPDTVVLFPKEESGSLRILGRARQQDAVVGEGFTRVELKIHAQLEALLIVQPGPLADADGDGVPDVVDSCPTQANPAQGPCTAADARVDMAPDRPVDRAGDLPPRDAPPCTCPLGCTASGSCRKLVPTGGYSAPASTSVPVVTQGSVSIDTTQCRVKNSASPAWKSAPGTLVTNPVGSTVCLFAIDQLVLEKSASLVAEGQNPLLLLVSQQVRISGTVDVGAHGNTPGPGGGAGGVAPLGGPGVGGAGIGGGKFCACSDVNQDDCGGGGGGYATDGAQGGTESVPCPTAPLGGPSWGDPALLILTGGSGGASANQATAALPVGSGGGGGGALQISCSCAIRIDGTVKAGGGGGQPAALPSGAPAAGGGGGGSGGSVLLEGISFSGSGVIGVTGGGGASAGSYVECTGPGEPGGNGGSLLASGGLTTSAACGAGGAGGDGATLPVPGKAADSGGGGGGGAAGRVRLNWFKHTTSLPVTVVGSGSVGEITVK
jgi:hypothetical protein